MVKINVSKAPYINISIVSGSKQWVGFNQFIHSCFRVHNVTKSLLSTNTNLLRKGQIGRTKKSFLSQSLGSQVDNICRHLPQLLSTQYRLVNRFVLILFVRIRIRVTEHGICLQPEVTISVEPHITESSTSAPVCLHCISCLPCLFLNFYLDVSKL